MRGGPGTPGAIALGLALASLPFLRYRLGSPHPTAHADHAPRRGGEVVMVGDAHLELVRGESGVEVCASDAYRRPLELVAGRVEAADGAATALAPESGCLRGAVEAPGAWMRLTVTLADGREAMATFAER